MTYSEPVVPCPSCKEGWKPLEAKHCSECYEGQIERLRAEAEAFRSLVGRISDYFHVNAKPSDDLALGYMRELDEIITRRSGPVPNGDRQ